MNARVIYPLLILGLAGCEGGIETASEDQLNLSSAQAQPASGSGISGSVSGTNFAGLVRKSVAESPSSAAGLASISASETRITSEQSALRPQLGAETSLTSDGDTVPILRLSQIIYDGGQVNSRVTLRRLESTQAWLSELAEMSARSFAAVEAIIDLDRDRRLEGQAQENLDRISSVVADLQVRFDAGAGSVADTLAGQGVQSNAETELAQARTDVAFSEATYVELFASRPGALPEIPRAPRLLGKTSSQMVERSPRLRTQQQVSAVRAQELAVTERSIRPTVAAILETDFDQGSIDDGAQARLGVDIPIYQGGLVNANIETAKASLAQSKAIEEELRREIQRSLDQALEETTSIAARLASARRAVKINDEALDAARGQFDLGRGTFLQILDALRELNTAQVRVIRLEAQERRAEYALLAVTGDILDALGVVQPANPNL